ncbi:MAG: helix-turn-helix transcriptional regulator [Defluviitaleaceae bacterium]|nr:helix-turn-helix transcriptional regulator [Defluviitaleaceae bacterium]
MKNQIILALKDVLESKNITRYELAKRTGTHYPIIDKYYKNKVVRYDSEILLRICIALDCEIGDIIKII